MTELHVSLVQSDLVWEDKQSNLAVFEKHITQIEKSDLIVLPEMFSTGFSMESERLAEPMSGPTVSWLTEQADRFSICGSLIIEDKGQFYNRFILAEANGGMQYYDKRHLFRMAQEHQHYSPGTQRMSMMLKQFRLCPQVCYDLRFPVWSRNTDQYDVLIFVANWPAARRDHWLTLLKARAIENQCYVIGVNRIGTDAGGTAHAGDSVVIDFTGQVILNLKDQESVQSVTLDKDALALYRTSFPSWKDADGFAITE